MSENDTKTETENHVFSVSPKVMAEFLGVSDRRIRQMAEEKTLVKSGRGKYNLIESGKNYIAFLKANNDMKKFDESSNELDADVELAKYRQVKTEKEKLTLALMQNTMHRSEDVEFVLTDMLLSFKERLLIMPLKLTPILAGLKNKAEIEKIISSEALEVLGDLKEYNANDFVTKNYVNIEDECEDDADG